MTDKNKERFHVFFESGYWGKSGRGRAGTEIPLHSSFEWGDEIWHIPAIHAFAKGAVMDFCVEIQANRLKDFLQKWGLCAVGIWKSPRSCGRKLRGRIPCVLITGPIYW